MSYELKLGPGPSSKNKGNLQFDPLFVVLSLKIISLLVIVAVIARLYSFDLRHNLFGTHSREM